MAYTRINIIRQSSEIVNGRKAEESEKVYYSCYAEISELGIRELYEALNLKLENTVAFKVRFCQKIKKMKPHVKDFEIEYEGERYSLFTIDFKNSDSGFAILKANCIS